MEQKEEKRRKEGKKVEEGGKRVGRKKREVGDWGKNDCQFCAWNATSYLCVKCIHPGWVDNSSSSAGRPAEGECTTPEIQEVPEMVWKKKTIASSLVPASAHPHSIRPRCLRLTASSCDLPLPVPGTSAGHLPRCPMPMPAAGSPLRTWELRPALC